MALANNQFTLVGPLGIVGGEISVGHDDVGTLIGHDGEVLHLWSLVYKVNLLEAGAASEGIISNVGDIGRDGNLFQAGAAFEYATLVGGNIYEGHEVVEGDFLKLCIALEGIAKASYGECLFVAEVAITIGVPLADADVLERLVLKGDILCKVDDAAGNLRPCGAVGSCSLFVVYHEVGMVVEEVVVSLSEGGVILHIHGAEVFTIGKGVGGNVAMFSIQIIKEAILLLGIVNQFVSNGFPDGESLDGSTSKGIGADIAKIGKDFGIDTC